MRTGGHWGLGGILTSMLVASLAGCSSEVISGNGTGGSNEGSGGARTDARAAGAGGRQGSGGPSTPTGGHVAAGGTHGIVDASLGNAGAVSDGGHVFVPPPQQDAGPTPPPYCVAPCVWEVVKHCIPELHSCVQTPGPGISATLTCDPTTGWSEYSGLVASKTFRFSVSYKGVECFRWNSGGIPGLVATSFADGLGNVVATQVAGLPLYCGASLADILSAHTSNRVTDAGIGFGDGGFAPAYKMDPSLPECAAWDENGLPVRTHCEVTDGGVCP